MKLKYLDPQISTVNLNGWWKLYEQSSFDYSLNGNNGTDTSTSNGDRGYVFDGADSKIAVSAASTIDINGKTAITFCAWVNTASDGEGNFGRILDKISGTAGYSVFVWGEAGGAVELGCWIYHDGAADAKGETSTTALVLNRWTHIACVYNEDSAKRIKIYLNGSLQALGTNQAGVGTVDDDSAIGLTIGNRSADDRTFDGTISDVQIYNSAKSVAEVKSIYEVTRRRYGN